MEVILLERIESLGQMGDVVRVKDGFARNYLLPLHKALRATDENRKVFESRRAQLVATNIERRGEAEAVAKKLDGQAVVLIRQAGEGGQLYGSVSARDIADGLTKAGFTVGRQQVRLDTPIKTVGLHKIRVDLHPEVTVRVDANVARSPDEAAIQAKTGQAVILNVDDRVDAEAAAAELNKDLLEAAPEAEGEEAAAAPEAAAEADEKEIEGPKTKKERRKKSKAEKAE
ncbi:MAG: 50S ribosomal protein L9 [Rhodospirillales bacterium]|nr:50S ribosomal protein L9 [Rhodospirillales bacterium]